MHLFEYIVNLVLLYQTPQIFSEYFDFLVIKGPWRMRKGPREWVSTIFHPSFSEDEKVLNGYM